MKVWNGANKWVSSYGVSADIVPANASTEPSLALLGSIPVVSFVEEDHVYVRRWVGSTNKYWLTFSPGPVDRTLANPAAAPALAVKQGPGVVGFRPVVVWDENNGSSTDVFVSQF